MLCALGGFSLLLGLASREQRLQRWTRPLSGLVWAALLALGHAFLFTGGVVSAWDQVRGAAGGAGRRRGGKDSRASNLHSGHRQRAAQQCQPAASRTPPPGVLFHLCHLHHVCHAALGHARRRRRGPHFITLTPAGSRAVSWASARLTTGAAASGEHTHDTGSTWGWLPWVLLACLGIHQLFAEL